MEILFVFSIILILTYIVLNVVVILVMGIPPKDGDIVNKINHEIPNGVSLNPFDKSILRIGKMKGFVTNTPIPGLLFKYYIYRIGVIPIWYKSHEIIKQLYKDENNED